MNKERGNSNSEWKARDELFRSMVNELFDGHLSKKLVEKTRQEKLEGKKLSNLDMVLIAKSVLLHRHTPERQKIKQEQILSRFNDKERTIVELALGMNYCGKVPGKEEICSQVKIKSEELDKIIFSASSKLNPRKK